jgi:hypothetical protein
MILQDMKGYQYVGLRSVPLFPESLPWPELKPVFGNRLHFRVPSSNPRERVRINAVNSKLKSADGTVRMMVDPVKCPSVVKDFEGVRLLEGGTGEIDKKSDPLLSHWLDAIGYYIEKEFPIVSRVGGMVHWEI